METKLPPKYVTEDFFKDFLHEKKYVTENFLENFLHEKKYVTEDFLQRQDYVSKTFLKEQDYVTRSFLDQRLEDLTDTLIGSMQRMFDAQDEKFEYRFQGLNNRLDDLSMNRVPYENHMRLEKRVEKIEGKLGMA
jgi:succinate dehydrogenase flavin-adding protein (antitoxin of CptAB toxin-antitoxin module)